jgi:hypothetical protein
VPVIKHAGKGGPKGKGKGKHKGKYKGKSKGKGKDRIIEPEFPDDTMLYPNPVHAPEIPPLLRMEMGLPPYPWLDPPAAASSSSGDVVPVTIAPRWKRGPV